MFPNISTIDDLLPHVSHRPEIRREDSHGYSVLCYMIAAEDTFSDAYARECRGITFGSDGRIVGRPLHKFFNVGERPETMPGALDFSAAVRVMDKRDGSIVSTVNVDGTRFTLKSKKSFDSHIAKGALAFTAERDDSYGRFCSACVSEGLTASFEWTSIDSRIVIDYGREPTLVLLHIRENVSGRYLALSELHSLAGRFGVSVVSEAPIEGDPLKAAAAVDGIEGWVLQFADGEMVKLKTRWYLDRHHAFTALRRRDVARAVVNQSIDDLKSRLSLGGVDITPILAIEKEVRDAIGRILTDVLAMKRSAEEQELAIKEVAIANHGHPYFALLMQAVRGREPDVNTYFDRHVLDGMFDLDLAMRP